MNIKDALAGRLHLHDIRRLCAECREDRALAESLLALAAHEDDRIAYNALWTLTHFPPAEIRKRHEWRDPLIDMLLASQNIGRQRLILTLLEAIPAQPDDIRPDYLDFCLARINSTAPYAIRALSLKQAYALCRHYPELLRELEAEIELMDCGSLSPGLICAGRNILKKLRRRKS